MKMVGSEFVGRYLESGGASRIGHGWGDHRVPPCWRSTGTSEVFFAGVADGFDDGVVGSVVYGYSEVASQEGCNKRASIIRTDNTPASMDISVQNSQVINGKTVTTRQLEALLAVQDAGSQTAAAKRLGISVPVLHKYIHSMEEAVGAPVVTTSPSGSILTEEGERVASLARSMGHRCETDRGFTVCCSPVTEDLTMSVISSLKIAGASVVVSDDEYNIRMMREDRADLAIIDDPLYLFDAEEFQMEEIGYMGMVMVDNVRALDEAGFADLDTIVSLLYTVYFAGYTTARDGRRMETR